MGADLENRLGRIAKMITFALPKKGEMSEWLKEHAWKACVPQKGTVGSNPTLSADNFECQRKGVKIDDFHPFFVKIKCKEVHLGACLRT